MAYVRDLVPGRARAQWLHAAAQHIAWSVVAWLAFFLSGIENE